ncbi:MAG: sulfotransferase family protein [Gemmatimonadaceae bacterium]
MERCVIVGCQRSGTTLMRLILESHSKIACVDETLSYQMLARGGDTAPAGSRMAYKIPVWTEQLLEPVLDVNELSSVAGQTTLPSFYRGEQIIFMVRHPLDTIVSMMRLKLGAMSWLERVGIPVLEQKLRNPDFVAAFRDEVARLDASSDRLDAEADRLIAFAALFWKVKTAALLRYRAAGLPVHAVTYERLVATPAPVLRDLMIFLRLEWEDALLRHDRTPHAQIRDGRAVGGTDPTRPIDEDSVGQWSTMLTPSQQRVARSIVGSLEDTLGYCDSAAALALEAQRRSRQTRPLADKIQQLETP